MTKCLFLVSFGGSRSRPSYSSVSRPAVHHPSSFSHPSHYAPAPAPKITRPIGFQVPQRSHSSQSAVSPPVHLSPTHSFNTNSKPVTQGAHTPSNVGFKPSITPSAPPAEHATVHASKPLGSGNVGHSANSNTPPPYGFKPSAPVGHPVNAKPVGNTPPGAPYPIQPPSYSPHNPGVPPPAYNPAGYGPHPAYNYHPNQNYHNGYTYPQHGGGVTNININNINTNTHHYGGTGGWGGHSYPSYHYSSNEVGSGALGFFLGYSLAKITTPTFYSHPTFYNGYIPR